ncbi:uncharacterized protein EV422DRAFT_607056 [Fimicolochytrium jonesii]|uniref:uncharacterized protein n=1 Tax=Fimicolochytrium jonesii TaxID=1396493 RepID=UPI0022FE3495|nr:uncharacterized protein EV422DRAFT_607056 [Fimicolochytrium jonesii]KAI8816961.1 hypothetical protein EV422DRAFT_607056 [Fimicolochytrium jonesii]
MRWLLSACFQSANSAANPTPQSVNNAPTMRSLRLLLPALSATLLLFLLLTPLSHAHAAPPSSGIIIPPPHDDSSSQKPPFTGGQNDDESLYLTVTLRGIHDLFSAFGIPLPAGSSTTHVHSDPSTDEATITLTLTNWPQTVDHTIQTVISTLQFGYTADEVVAYVREQLEHFVKVTRESFGDRDVVGEVWEATGWREKFRLDRPGHVDWRVAVVPAVVGYGISVAMWFAPWWVVWIVGSLVVVAGCVVGHGGYVVGRWVVGKVGGLVRGGERVVVVESTAARVVAVKETKVEKKRQ